MHFRMTARGTPIAPIRMLINQSCQLKGTVLAKVPKNSTITAWNATVEATTPMNIQLLSMPWNTFIFSIWRLLISLNTWWGEGKENTMWVYEFSFSYWNFISDKLCYKYCHLQQKQYAFPLWAPFFLSSPDNVSIPLVWITNLSFLVGVWSILWTVPWVLW